MAQSFGAEDPRPDGFDGAVEFPPHKLVNGLATRNAALTWLDHAATAQVYDYGAVAAASLAEAAAPYPLIKTAVPGWDNDARRQGHGMVLHGATPAAYQEWLAALVGRSARHAFLGERLVCVNAWNEWAEGAYLEPDLYYGGAWLNATARAIAPEAGFKSLLLVGHDAFPAGAQHLLLNLGRVLARRFGVRVEFLLLGGGALEAQYAAVAPTTVPAEPAALAQRIAAAAAGGVTAAVVNTAAAASVIPMLRRRASPPCCWCTRCRASCTSGTCGRRPRGRRSGQARRVPGRGRARGVRLFGGGAARAHSGAAAGLLCPHHLRPGRPGGAAPPARPGRRAPGSSSAPEWGTCAKALICSCRPGAPRCGGARACSSAGSARSMPLHWPGSARRSPPPRPPAPSASRVGRTTFPPWFSAADAFVLSSREDPFPSVVVEALSSGLPVAAFAESGGVPGPVAGEWMRRDGSHGRCAGACRGAAPAAGRGAVAAAVRARLRRGHSCASVSPTTPVPCSRGDARVGGRFSCGARVFN